MKQTDNINESIKHFELFLSTLLELHSKKSDLLSFFITDLEVVFEDVKKIMIKNDFISKTVYVVAPAVPAEEEESRRLFLLNYFSNVVKNNQLFTAMDLFKFLSSCP